MAFLTPDKIITTPNGLTIKQKIIPDSLVATKDEECGIFINAAKSEAKVEKYACARV